MVSGIVCEASRSNLGMLVEPLYWSRPVQQPPPLSLGRSYRVENYCSDESFRPSDADCTNTALLYVVRLVWDLFLSGEIQQPHLKSSLTPKHFWVWHICSPMNEQGRLTTRAAVRAKCAFSWRFVEYCSTPKGRDKSRKGIWALSTEIRVRAKYISFHLMTIWNSSHHHHIIPLPAQTLKISRLHPIWIRLVSLIS